MSRAIYEEICRDFPVYFYSFRVDEVVGFTDNPQPVGTTGNWRIPNPYTFSGVGEEKTMTVAFLSFEGRVYPGYSRGEQASEIANKISMKYGDDAFSGITALPWLFK